MRKPLRLLRILALVALGTGSLSTAAFPTPAGGALPVKPNVLFIAIDDLNHCGSNGRSPVPFRRHAAADRAGDRDFPLPAVGTP